MRDKFINFLVAAVSLAVALAAVEIGLRLFTPSSAPLAVPDAKIGISYRPEVTQKGYYNSESMSTISVATNSYGFRDDEWDPSWENVVMVLGDSFVAGFEVAKEQRFTELLQSSLSSTTSTDWHVLNLGISGTGPEAYLERLRVFGPVFNPDHVVVTIFNGNDLQNLNYDLDPAAGRINYTVEDGQVVRYDDVASLKEKVIWGVKLFLGQSYLVQLAHDALVKFENRGSADPAAEAVSEQLPGYCSIPPGELSDSFAILDSLLSEMDQLSGRHLLIVDIPDKAQLSAGLPPSCNPTLVEDHLTGFSAKEGIPLINAYDAFKGRSGDELYFAGHLNPAGHAAVAQLLSAALASSTLSK